MRQHAIPCLLMRGGTSKAAMFLAEDLPSDKAARDAVLLRVMGSPDKRQIDGVGGADPLTSKVAIIARSDHPEADIDYLFAQVSVDEARVDYGQNCGNILAAVGPFAVERGLIKAGHSRTRVAIHMQNTQQIAIAEFATPDGVMDCQGNQAIDGVPGTAAEIILEFKDIAGSVCGALLPTGNASDILDGVAVTCIDNGMPVVLINAADLTISGYETRQQLDDHLVLKQKLERIRLQAGRIMNLGDVSQRTIPKMTIISPPRQGGALNTRTFIPHRCYASIGVLGAVSVATACLIQGSVASQLAKVVPSGMTTISVEHPEGEFGVRLKQQSAGGIGAGLIRTARLIFAGEVMIPAVTWSAPQD
jgi:4-oxalomesaconate tautomerase